MLQWNFLASLPLYAGSGDLHRRSLARVFRGQRKVCRENGETLVIDRSIVCGREIFYGFTTESHFVYVSRAYLIKLIHVQLLFLRSEILYE